jgi:hypothetical protein
MIEAFTGDQRKAYVGLSKAIDAYNRAPVSELADTRRVKDVLTEVMGTFSDELLVFCNHIISDLGNENDDIYPELLEESEFTYAEQLVGYVYIYFHYIDLAKTIGEFVSATHDLNDHMGVLTEYMC